MGCVPKNPYKADFTETDSQLVFLAFAYDSRTKGNAATEIAKALPPAPLPHQEGLPATATSCKRGNFYQSN